MAAEFIYQFVPANGSATTILLLHEVGGDENDLIPVGRGIAKGAALLSLRGRVDENGASRFFRRAPGGECDENCLRDETAAIETAVRDAAGKHGFDPTRVVAVAYSDGAEMAAALLLAYPKLLAGAVLLRASLPAAPEALIPLAGTPVMIVAGQRDIAVPSTGTEKLAQTLSYAGAQVEVRWHNLGHELGPEDFAAAREFLKNML